MKSIQICLIVCLFLLCGFINGFAENTAQSSVDASEVLYTAYNIWYEKPEKIWCVNYKVGAVLPMGTEITGLKFGAYRKYQTISFKTPKDNKEFIIFWNQKFHPNKTVEDYVKNLFPKKNFQELTSGFNKEEIHCIKSGFIQKGISKAAVLASYGYPPEHYTYSLKNETWTYWLNRFKKIIVTFDANGKVVAVN